MYDSVCSKALCYKEKKHTEKIFKFYKKGDRKVTIPRFDYSQKDIEQYGQRVMCVDLAPMIVIILKILFLQRQHTPFVGANIGIL